MHPLSYVLLRLIRRMMPEPLVRFLLENRLVLQPGRDTSEPRLSAEGYERVLREYGQSLEGRRVLVFGYGGHFGIAAELLRQGAAHVALCDKFARPNEIANAGLPAAFPGYFEVTPEGVRPKPGAVSLHMADIRDLVGKLAPVDVVVSTSVYEHLPASEIDSITAALAGLTRQGGAGIHFIDLRDHHFAYPFEMLTFQRGVWERWLNPSCHLNRFRVGEYRRVFERHSAETQICFTERNPAQFEQAKPRILREFLTGDDGVDAVTQIRVVTLAARKG
jgi:hypothetical protein